MSDNITSQHYIEKYKNIKWAGWVRNYIEKCKNINIKYNNIKIKCAGWVRWKKHQSVQSRGIWKQTQKEGLHFQKGEINSPGHMKYPPTAAEQCQKHLEQQCGGGGPPTALAGAYVCRMHDSGHR